jgi:NAD dependent epimerase/dehydratase
MMNGFEALRGRKVLVTGADGFIGSHLCEALLDCGCQVKAFVFYNSLGSWGWLDSLAPERRAQLEIVAGDVRDAYCVLQAIGGVDVVFHLAALIAIPFSYQAPDSYVETNIKGTLNVLQAARKVGTARVLITSTSEVYGTARYVPIDEQHPFQGQSPYSASKIGADRLAESFYRSFDLPVTIVRPFNTYGPRQSARAVIPSIIAQLLSGRTELRLGRLDPTRDFNYVSDTCAGFLSLAACDRAVGEEVNVASGCEISIGDLAGLIVEECGCTASIKTEAARHRPRKSEVERLLGSNEKISTLTEWRPQVSLREGLRRTIEWFRVPGNLERYRPDVFSM